MDSIGNLQNLADQNEIATKQLQALMQEYMTIKKVERESIFANLHPDIRKRVCALKNLQLETINLEAEFHRDVYVLEHKYQEKHDAVFKKRSSIVNGSYQPSEEECKSTWSEMPLEDPTEGQEKPMGIPGFWLTLMQNVKDLNNMIQESDEKVLMHLIDVRAFTKPAPDLSFQLEFHFEPNKFFQDSVLTKTYLMKCSPDAEDPFMFEGPEIYKTIGCEIKWNDGMNVVDQGPKSISPLGCFKTESFFNFFSPPELKAEVSDENEKIESFLEADFEIGHYLKERVVPRAVLFFTGEIDEEVSDDDDYQEDDIEGDFEKMAIESGDN